MKVLVTGASGGLGELVVNQLLLKGHEVIASSRNLEKAKACSFFEKVNFKEYQFKEKEDKNLFLFFEKPDALIHLAWDNLNEYKSELHLTTILQQHKEFLLNLFKNGLQNMNGVGTVYEYGLKEGILKESDSCVPLLPYPQGKDQLRQFIENQQKNYGFSFKWVRIFYVFGEVKGRKNLYTLLKEAIANNQKTFNMSGGEQIRDFLSPKQIAELLVDISVQTEITGIINCCSGKPIKLKDKVSDFLKEQQYEMALNLGHYPYLDYEPMESWGSVEKLNKILEKNKFES